MQDQDSHHASNPPFSSFSRCCQEQKDKAIHFLFLFTELSVKSKGSLVLFSAATHFLKEKNSDANYNKRIPFPQPVSPSTDRQCRHLCLALWRKSRLGVIPKLLDIMKVFTRLTRAASCPLQFQDVWERKKQEQPFLKFLFLPPPLAIEISHPFPTICGWVEPLISCLPRLSRNWNILPQPIPTY